MAKAPLAAPPPSAPPVPAAPPAPPADPAVPGSPAVTPPTDNAAVTASGAPPSNDLTPHVEGGTPPQEVAASGIVPAAPAPNPPNSTEAEPVPTVGDEGERAHPNLGDWDNDGNAGGAAKSEADMTNVELAEKAAASVGRIADDELERKRGKELPNGRKVDDTFIQAYKNKVALDEEQEEIDGMSVEDRLLRLERAAGLRSPTQG